MAAIFGMRELDTHEEVWTLDVNQWAGVYLQSIGHTVAVRDTAKAGTRIFEYALSGRRTVDGKRIIVGTSDHIMLVFMHMLNKRYGISPKEARAWFITRVKVLHERGAVVVDTTKQSWEDLTRQAELPNGMPDADDQGVFNSAINLGSKVIATLDEEFQAIATRRGIKCMDPRTVFCVMPA